MDEDRQAAPDYPADDDQVDTAPGGTSDHPDSTAPGTPDHPDTNPDGGISLTAAVALLGISERTARRRIKEGTLPAHKLDTPQGGVWCIHPDMTTRQPDKAVNVTTRQEVDHLAPADQPVKEPPADARPAQAQPGAPEVLELVHLVDRLQRENQQMSGQLGFMQAKVQEQERIIALLMAPKESEPADVTPAEVPAAGDAQDWQAVAQALEERVKQLEQPAAPEQARRPWWRKLFSG